MMGGWPFDLKFYEPMIKILEIYFLHLLRKLEWVEGNADILSHPGP